MPLALVVTIAEEVNAPLAPEPGAVKVTLTPETGSPASFSTSTAKFVAKAVSTLADCGVNRQEFEKAVPDLAKAAFMDPSIRTNPRIPMIREVIELLEAGYSGGA